MTEHIMVMNDKLQQKDAEVGQATSKSKTKSRGSRTGATRCGASRGSAQLFLNTKPQNSPTLFGETIETFREIVVTGALGRRSSKVGS